MKFCKNLQKVVDLSDPEWTPFWVNYKMLKKIIKELVPQDSAKLIVATPSVSEEEKDGGTPSNMQKHPGETIFFKLLHSEFKKSIHFFTRAQAEFGIRHERIKDAMEYSKQPGALMVHDRWSQLAKALYTFYKDLLLLENYAIMTYCSFSKILKKHDKNTGFVTREKFMMNIVSKANFSKYPTVVKMLKDSEALFEEVAGKLQEEGKGNLHRDEKLFIEMIHKLNAQATGVQNEEMADLTTPKSSSSRYDSSKGAENYDLVDGGGKSGNVVNPLRTSISEIVQGGEWDDKEDIKKKLTLVKEDRKSVV